MEGARRSAFVVAEVQVTGVVRPAAAVRVGPVAGTQGGAPPFGGLDPRRSAPQSGEATGEGRRAERVDASHQSSSMRRRRRGHVEDPSLTADLRRSGRRRRQRRRK